MRSLFIFLLTAGIAPAALAPAQAETVLTQLKAHQLPQAEAAANALVASHPADPQAYVLLGTVAITKGDADAAVAAFEKATELAPGSGDYQRQLGDAYGFAAQKAGVFSKMGWAKKCRLAYEKAVELEPANLDARSSLMTFYQQAPGLMGGGMDKAYAQAAAIKQLDANRGRIAFAMLNVGEKKYPEAFAALDETLHASPENYLALYQFGRTAALSGQQIDRGLAALTTCLKLAPPPGAPGHDAAQWRIGNLRERQGDKQAARAAYEAALALNPNFQQAADSLKKLN